MPRLPNFDDEDVISNDLFPITSAAQLKLAAKNLMHYANEMDENHAEKLIREVIISADIYRDNIRKIKQAIPLALCRVTDELDVNFAANYVRYEREKYIENREYKVFTDKFFDDETQAYNYGSVDNPLRLPSISFSYNYFDSLVRLFKGSITYERIGKKSIKDSDTILDIFKIKSIDITDEIEVVVNPYAGFYCTAIPNLPF